MAARMLSLAACVASWGCISHGDAPRGAPAARGDSREAEAPPRETAGAVTAQVKAGEEALAREDYEAAARAFDAAFQASGEARLQRRASYASSMDAARHAIEQRAFDVASGHLRTALATQEDRGRARALLEEVEPRVYRLRLESVTITQTKPGTTQPWIGKPWWREAAPAAAAAVGGWYGGPKAGKLAHDLTDAVAGVPPENRPALVVFMDLPDGRRLKTQKVKGIYVIYGAELFVYTNKLDNRTLRLTVIHERSGGDESVAVANLPLGQIVSGKIDTEAIRGSAQALQQVVFSADPAEVWQDGAIGNAELQDQQENRASARSTPTRSASRARLLTASLSMPVDGSDGVGGRPDPFFEIYQGRKQVFKSTTMQDTRTADWSFSSTDLYLDPNEEVIVKLTDADLASNDQIATWTVSAREFLAGQARLTTPRGTTLILGCALRADRPR